MIDDGPVAVELDRGNTPAAKNGIPRRAATEGRPYSTFHGARENEFRGRDTVRPKTPK